MSGFIKTPFTLNDGDGNALVVDRLADVFAFQTCAPDGPISPVVRIPLHTVSLVFSHLTATATAEPVPEHPRD